MAEHDVVRIDDWSDPVFPPEAAALRESVRPLAEAIVLEPDALVAEARAATGLDDLGIDDDPGWTERLGVLLAGLRDEAGLDAWGTVSSAGLVGQLVRNRLLLADLLIRHPEIHAVELEPPIVIAGLPRTGTTHLHNLLAADPGLRSLPYWESLEPVLAPAEQDVRPDPRLARTASALEIVNGAVPLFRRMHEMTVDHSHEEIQLLAIDMSSMLFETTAPMPTWRDHYLARDQAPTYRYLRTVLQALCFLRPDEPTRWVLKSPQHQEQLPALLEAFPDATVVLTHRDPVEVTTSMCTMIGYTARMSTAHPDPAAIGAYWAPRVEQLLLAGLRDHDVVPAHRVVDIRLPDLVADDAAQVERIYAAADQPLPDEARAAMAAFVAAHPRGRFGRVAADPAVFGIDVGERVRALRAYTTRFGV
jgi:PAS domain-containing protein